MTFRNLNFVSYCEDGLLPTSKEEHAMLKNWREKKLAKERESRRRVAMLRRKLGCGQRGKKLIPWYCKPSNSRGKRLSSRRRLFKRRCPRVKMNLLIPNHTQGDPVARSYHRQIQKKIKGLMSRMGHYNVMLCKMFNTYLKWLPSCGTAEVYRLIWAVEEEVSEALFSFVLKREGYHGSDPLQADTRWTVGRLLGHVQGGGWDGDQLGQGQSSRGLSSWTRPNKK